MLRNRKLKTVITSCIAIIAVICISCLYIMQNQNTTSVMRKVATNHMLTALDAQANMIRQYVDNAERLLREYGSAHEIKAVMEKPTDKECQKLAQEYTERFTENLVSWEGVYASNWNTTVLAHSSKDAVGMTTRTGDSLAPYLSTMTDTPDGFYNGGVYLSPVSGVMILNMRMAIFNDRGTPIGLVGGVPYISGLRDILYDFSVSGLEQATYSILDSDSRVYVIDDIEANIAKNVEDSTLSSVLDKVANGASSGTIEYKKGKDSYLMCYKSLPEYHLVLTMSDSTEHVFSESRNVSKKLFSYCVIVLIIILIAIYFVSGVITGPLKNIEEAVNDLGNLSLKKNDSIQSYVGTNSEIGKMATSVNNLTNVWSDMMESINASVNSIAAGDFRQKLSCNYEGEFKVLADSLNSIVISMESTLYRINKYTNNFADGSEAFDRAAHALANDTTSQASAVTQVTATIQDISDRINENASNSNDANQKMQGVQQMLIKSSDDINELAKAMEMIQEDADQINSIAKTMQDIASTTKLLSMNASVEASRAGQAGQGFNIVAMEIRSLSEQCSKATKETTELIERTRKNVNNSMEYLNATVDSIKAVSKDSKNAGKLVGKISNATSEQAKAICQVSEALQQISDITQNNSTTAVECAQVSEDMKSKAQKLKNILSGFYFSNM